MGYRIANRTGIIAALLAPVVMLGGVAAAQPAPSAQTSTGSENKRHVTTDAQTIFRGALFGLGPVAKLVNDNPPDPTPELSDAAERLTTEVDRVYPGTVQSVADAVATGSPQAVKATLTTATARLNSLINATSGPTRLISPNCVLLVFVLWVLWVLPDALTSEQTRLDQERAALALATQVE